MMDYDENMVLCGRTARQVVRLTFGSGKYRADRLEAVGGNCTGLSVIEAAVEAAYDNLTIVPAYGPQIRLKDSDGNILICEDEDDRGDEWLRRMLISAEIISIEPS